MSKTIRNHPAVQECLRGEETGVIDYKYDIFLKEGWAFEKGHLAGFRTLHCNTVAEFLHANPIPLANHSKSM